MLADKYIVLRSRSLIVPTLDNVGTFGFTSLRRNRLEPISNVLEIEEIELNKPDMNDLRRDPRTLAIAPPMPLKLIEPVEKKELVNAPAAASTWGIDAVGASNSIFDGEGITVAVLDTGIDSNHPAFAGVNLQRKNFTTESDDDVNGHGTHCAGTIFGQDVNGTRIGVARNINKALIGKVLGEGGGSSVTIAQAINWAVNEGANVISMSLGIDFPGYVNRLVELLGVKIEPATSMALEGYRANVQLFTELARFVEQIGSILGQGTIIVAASGNESDRPDYEIAVAPPAAGNGVIAVGALEQSGNGLSVARFSNNEVNVSAPGVDVISAWPGGGLRSLSGTSMATPHVAGVAALWAQRQLKTTERVDQTTLMSQLIASGTMAPLVADAEAEDVGAGIVQSPSS